MDQRISVGGKNKMLIAKWAPLILLLSLPGVTGGQQEQGQTPPASDHQQDSIAAAARRTREAKKEQAKPTKVWDNQSLADAPGVISVVGQPAASNDNSARADGTNPAAGGPPSAGGTAAIDADLNTAKANLQNFKVDLDLLQRKYALDQQTYYGKPEYSSDTAGAADLASEKNQIDSKQQEITNAERKVADLQAQLDAANKSSGNAP
jgi:type I restriction-modification system DNA methylase subunit